MHTVDKFASLLSDNLKLQSLEIYFLTSHVIEYKKI